MPEHIPYTYMGGPEDSFDPQLSPEPFEAAMLKRVGVDYRNASEYLKAFHQRCYDRYNMYHNQEQYDALAKKNMFPVPFLSEQVDVFVADLQEKLWYKGLPCRITGREASDKADAEAKDAMMRYQDEVDEMYSKTGLAARDAALYGVCIAQVDYVEVEKLEPNVVQSPYFQPNEMTAFTGQIYPVMDEGGQLVMESRVEYQKAVIYKGPSVKRIDPLDFFFTQDKAGRNDSWPIMVRSFQSKDFFSSAPWFYNQDKIKVNEQGDARSSEGYDPIDKKSLLGFQHQQGKGERPIEYVEWQGLVDKLKLYEFLQKDTALVAEGEKCMAICGVVNGATVVRLDESPFDFGRPNIIIGVVTSEEDMIVGGSIAEKVAGVQKGMDKVMGILLTNFKQAVNAGHVINTSGIVSEGNIEINKDGFVLETTSNVNDVHKRIEQPRVAPDIYTLLSILAQYGQNNSGIQDLGSGRGDKLAETLGEAEIVSSKSAQRMNHYMRMFETSFVKPLYEMRNAINVEFLDADYVYSVIGDGAVEWRVISPAQIRAKVDFVCDSAMREAQKTILVQQILQTAQIAPLCAQLGQPVRLDLMLADLGTDAYGWNREKVERYFPLVKMERVQGADVVSDMMVQNALVQQQMQGMAAMMGGQPSSGGGSQGQNGQGGMNPHSQVGEGRTNSEAQASNNARNRTQIGR